MAVLFSTRTLCFSDPRGSAACSTFLPSSHEIRRPALFLPKNLRLGEELTPLEKCRRQPIEQRRKANFYATSSASAETIPNAEKTDQSRAISAIKRFLEELKSVGRVRIIVNTGVGVLESVTTLEKLFYHTLPARGEYANLMNKEENVDFHLLLDKVKCAKLGKGKSMTGDIPTYTIRIMDDEDKAAALFLVMWKPGTNGEYDDGQVEAFEALLAKHGDTVAFPS